MGEPRLRLLEPGLYVFKGQANFYMHGGSFRNSPSDAEFGICWLEATALLHRNFHLLL